MDSGRPFDASEPPFPILSEVEQRYNGKIGVVCYPVGLAAYFADQILYHNAEPIDLINEIRENKIRRVDGTLTVYPEPLNVAVDSLVSNNFYMLLAGELTEAKIYDAETFFEFMQNTSPTANQLGVIGNNPRGRFRHLSNVIPEDIKF